MKVLIIHHRPEVSEQIREVVLESSSASDSCDIVEDAQNGKRKLAEQIYDLLILDLTIPLSPTLSRPGFDAAEQLLDELFNADTLNPPGDVIGITKDPDALNLVENSLGPHLMLTIPEDSEGKWKSYLRDKLAYARRASHTRSVSVSQHYDYDALIVTAMDIELEPYRRMFNLLPIRHFKSAYEFLFNDGQGSPRRGIVYAIGRSGQASAASFTQALITFFRPRVALMSGYCGGVRNKVQLGDLIFFESAYAWDYGKWAEEGKPPKAVFRARPDPIGIADQPLHDAARTYCLAPFQKEVRTLQVLEEEQKGRANFGIHLKHVASGSAVVAADDIVARIRGLSDTAWAVDMEAYGFYHAALHTRGARPDVLCVKAVSDFSNGEKGDELHMLCSRLSAEVVYRLLTSDWNFRDRTHTYHQS